MNVPKNPTLLIMIVIILRYLGGKNLTCEKPGTEVSAPYEDEQDALLTGSQTVYDYEVGRFSRAL